ncbi:MAG TPA: hypothetical protein ENJ29_03890 [Bacteroidetes bacterium]|nr:hypothetical protein [Bacteroidota bacterium]
MKSSVFKLTTLKTSFVFRLYKKYIIDSILIVKRDGFKALIRERGWKLFAVVFTYYLIRDLILYVAIPLYISMYVTR